MAGVNPRVMLHGIPNTHGRLHLRDMCTIGVAAGLLAPGLTYCCMMGAQVGGYLSLILKNTMGLLYAVLGRCAEHFSQERRAQTEGINAHAIFSTFQLGAMCNTQIYCTIHR